MNENKIPQTKGIWKVWDNLEKKYLISNRNTSWKSSYYVYEQIKNLNDYNENRFEIRFFPIQTYQIVEFKSFKEEMENREIERNDKKEKEAILKEKRMIENNLLKKNKN